MKKAAKPAASAAGMAWPKTVHALFKRENIRQVAIVPDAGHSQLIRLIEADKSMRLVRLTTEEEGVALLAGAYYLLKPFNPEHAATIFKCALQHKRAA